LRRATKGSDVWIVKSPSGKFLVEGTRLDQYLTLGSSQFELDKNVSFEDFVQDSLQDVIYNRVLGYLDRKLRTTGELKKYISKLWREKYIKLCTGNCRDLIDESILTDKIIEKLIEYKLVNDLDYSRLFIEERIRFKPRSRTALFTELLQKGINKEIIESVLAESNIDDLATARELLVKKYGIESIPDDFYNPVNARMVNFLLRKGFTWDTVEQLKSEKVQNEFA